MRANVSLITKQTSAVKFVGALQEKRQSDTAGVKKANPEAQGKARFERSRVRLKVGEASEMVKREIEMCKR